jgi:hypothetical protein
MTELRNNFLNPWTDPPLALYFAKANAGSPNPTTLASAAAVDDTSITVVDATAFSVGDYIGISEGAGGDRFYFGEALTLPGGGVINLDTPLDFAFAAGSNVISLTRDLNVDGSVTPQVYEVRGAGAGSSITVNITRLIFHFICDSQPDDALFGNISALIKGIVIRAKNGTYRNIANIKTNADFANLTFDVSYTSRSVPAGFYGVRCRYTFGGQDKHDTIIPIAPTEALQIIVQDKLDIGSPDITQFRVIAEGRERP